MALNLKGRVGRSVGATLAATAFGVLGLAPGQARVTHAKTTVVLAAIGTLVLPLSACGSTAAPDPAVSANCGPYQGSITESAEYTPYDSQRSRLPDEPMNPNGDRATTVPTAAARSRIDGRALQWATVDQSGAAYQYFSAAPIGPKTTLTGFQASGGIALEATPVTNGVGVKDVTEQVGSLRAVPIDVGAYPGVVIWADPHDASGRRMHHVYWEAGGYLFGLILDAPPEQAVTVAREVACVSLATS